MFRLGKEPVKVELVKLYVELVVNVELSVLLDNAYAVVEVAFYFLSKKKLKIPNKLKVSKKFEKYF